MSTRVYRLVTGNHGLVEAMETNPPFGTGWKVDGELAEDGKIQSNEGVLLAPEGDELYRSKMGPGFLSDVRAKIKQDMAVYRPEGSDQPQASQYGGTLPDGPVQYRGTTGHKVAAQMLKAIVDPGGGWALAVEYYQGMDTNNVQLLDVDGAVIGSVAVLPINTLMSRVTAAIGGHRKGPAPAEPPADPPTAAPEQAVTDVAASAEPAAETPPGAEESAQAARQLAEGMRAAEIPAKESEVVHEITISKIGHFPGGNVRETFVNLEELADDIKRRGIKQPLIVNERDGRYTLLSGERRLRAAGLAGLTTVRCLVEHLSDAEALEWMLVENIQREDLNPVEEARAYQRLLNVLGSQGKVAERVGKSRVRVVEYLQLLELPPDLQHQVATGVQSVKNGLAYLRQTKEAPPEVRERVAQTLVAEQPTSREAPKVIDRVLEEQGVARATPPKQEPQAQLTLRPAAEPPVPPQPTPPAPASGQASTQPSPATPAQDAVVALFISRSLLNRFEALRGARSDVEFLARLLDDWEAFNRPS